jgi:hypothetical protein
MYITGRIACRVKDKRIVHKPGLKPTLTIMGSDHIPVLSFSCRQRNQVACHHDRGCHATETDSSDFDLTVQYTAPYTLTTKEF